VSSPSLSLWFYVGGRGGGWGGVGMVLGGGGGVVGVASDCGH